MQRARVAVIGSEAKEKLFSGRNALGERIRIDGLSFEVIGVLSPKMQEGDDNINRTIYVPFTTMSDLKDTHYLDSIWFNYETPAYEGLETVCARRSWPSEHKFNPTDRRAMFDLQSHGTGSPVRSHHARPENSAGFHRHADAGHWRGRPDEHHAGLGDATHARDRRGERRWARGSGHILLQFLAEALTITFIGGALGIMLWPMRSRFLSEGSLYTARWRRMRKAATSA